MPFCTKCGASVNGAFCSQCGTTVGSAASGATPVTQPAVAPVAAPPVRRKTSPLVWVLVALVGLFILGGIGVSTAAWYFAHHPGAVLAGLLSRTNPDLEIISRDDGARTFTVRNRHTGKESTVSFGDIKNGRLRIVADSDDGGTATVEVGGGGKLPSWVPDYPGSKSKATFSVKGSSGEGSGEAGNFMFTTSDSPSTVMAFYEDKVKALGMKLELPGGFAGGSSLLLATDEETKRFLKVVIAGDTVNVTYGSKD